MSDELTLAECAKRMRAGAPVAGVYADAVERAADRIAELEARVTDLTAEIVRIHSDHGRREGTGHA